MQAVDQKSYWLLPNLHKISLFKVVASLVMVFARKTGIEEIGGLEWKVGVVEFTYLLSSFHLASRAQPTD